MFLPRGFGVERKAASDFVLVDPTTRRNALFMIAAWLNSRRSVAAKKLFAAFGSPKAIFEAPVDALRAVAGIGPKTVQAMHETLHFDTRTCGGRPGDRQAQPPVESPADECDRMPCRPANAEVVDHARNLVEEAASWNLTGRSSLRRQSRHPRKVCSRQRQSAPCGGLGTDSWPPRSSAAQGRVG